MTNEKKEQLSKKVSFRLTESENSKFTELATQHGVKRSGLIRILLDSIETKSEEISIVKLDTDSITTLIDSDQVNKWTTKGLISFSEINNSIFRESTKLSLFKKAKEFRAMTAHIVTDSIKRNIPLVLTAFANKNKVASIFFRYFDQSVGIVTELSKLAIRGLLFVGNIHPSNSLDVSDLLNMAAEGVGITKTEKFDVNINSLIASKPYRIETRRAHFTAFLTTMAKMKVNAHKAFNQLYDMSMGDIVDIEKMEMLQSGINAKKTILNMDETEEMKELMLNNLNKFMSLIEGYEGVGLELACRNLSIHPLLKNNGTKCPLCKK